MTIVLGIDLGTSYSCAAAVRDETVVVVEDAEGHKTLPSTVHFGAGGEIVVGRQAQQQVPIDPEHTIYSAKRLLGRRFGDGAVRIARSAYFYKIVEGPNQWPMIEARGGPFTVPEVCACVLQTLKANAEQFFGERIEQAVVTVPANADDAQREQTRIAGRIAGLEVIRLINEPTAAALAYAVGGLRRRSMVVYDFGGGTFDCSVIRWGSSSVRVLATHGDSFLGGDDLDLAVARWLADEFHGRTGVDLQTKVVEWKRLLLATEAAKRALSRSTKTPIRLPEMARGARGPIDLEHELTRQELERLIQPQVHQTVELTLDAVALGGLEAEEVDEVVLVGGSSRIPLVRTALRRALGRTPVLDFDPDAVVAMGAAIEAQRLTGGRSPTLERAPQELIEVVPRAIGLATAGGGFDPVIDRNSELPVRGHRAYTTWRDGQREMRFVVLQGDSERAADNARLGEFVVRDLPSRPAGQVEVKLLFEVSSDGLLRASARDSTTDRIHRYRVRVSDSLRTER